MIENEQPWPVDVSSVGRLLDAWGLSKSPQEAVWVIAYDAKRTLRTVVEVARGGYIHVDIHVPSVLAPVLVSGSERFVVAHNHQDGIARASKQDVEMTTVIQDAAAAAGLYLEDHLIVTPRGATFSFKETGLWTPEPYGTGSGHQLQGAR